MGFPATVPILQSFYRGSVYFFIRNNLLELTYGVIWPAFALLLLLAAISRLISSVMLSGAISHLSTCHDGKWWCCEKERISPISNYIHRTVIGLFSSKIWNKQKEIGLWFDHVFCRAATNDYFHYQLIWRLFSRLVHCLFHEMSKKYLKMLIFISQSPICFPIASFVQTTAQNTKTPYCKNNWND